MQKDIYVITRHGLRELFNPDKIHTRLQLAAERAAWSFSIRCGNEVKDSNL